MSVGSYDVFYHLVQITKIFFHFLICLCISLTLFQVDCVLQYWEALIQQFIDYVDFDLLESEATEVILPEIREFDARNLVAAQIWRVFIRNENG